MYAALQRWYFLQLFLILPAANLGGNYNNHRTSQTLPVLIHKPTWLSTGYAQFYPHEDKLYTGCSQFYPQS